MEDLQPKPGDLSAIETASTDEIASVQLERMQRTFKHAYANSAFYKAQFNAHGVHPDDLKTRIPPNRICATTTRSICSP